MVLYLQYLYTTTTRLEAEATRETNMRREAPLVHRTCLYFGERVGCLLNKMTNMNDDARTSKRL